MNIGRIQTLCWLAVAGQACLIGEDVYRYLDSDHDRLRSPSAVEQAEAGAVRPLPDAAPERISDADVRTAFFELNWTGETPPAPPPPPPPPPLPQRDATPVTELLTVVLIQYLSFDAALSQTSVHYRPLVATYGSRDDVLREGARLPGKFSFIRVASVRPEYVEFEFDDEEGEEPREPERVYPPEYSPRGVHLRRIARQDRHGERTTPELPPRERFSPKRTREVRHNQFEIGSMDASRFETDFADILTREMTVERYRDPLTGRYAGIAITQVGAGSIVARHGLQPGDIIRSLNGEPVTSAHEAIRYVKTHADVTTHWVAVVERQGVEITLTYDYHGPSN